MLTDMTPDKDLLVTPCRDTLKGGIQPLTMRKPPDD
jgi:hypothetical protein